MLQYVLTTPAAPLSVPLVSTTNNSGSGTYWTLHASAPLPANFFPALPVYQLNASNRIFLIDDRSVDYQALQARQAAENATNGFGYSFSSSGSSLFDTNALWLEVPTNALAVSNIFNVVIRNTITAKYYDVLTKPDLLLPTWAVEKMVLATGDATPVSLWQITRTNLFVWAREAIIPVYQQPLSQEIHAGDTVTFTVVAGGSGLFYQWTFNGTNIYGATGSSLTIENANESNAGDYVCLIHNADGSETSQTATLTVDLGESNPSRIGMIGSRQDYTFRSGVVYLFHAPVKFYGKTTIEGGAVIKFDYLNDAPCLEILGALESKATPYNPTVLTTIDDEMIGSAGSYNNPGPVVTGLPYLDLTAAGSVSISNLVFRYADMAVAAPYQARLDLWDCQFFDCNACVVNDFGGVDSFHNVLLAGCYAAVAGYTNAYAVEMEQVTADVSSLCDSVVSPARLALTNSIIFGGIGSSPAYSAQNIATALNATNFVAMDIYKGEAGNYYLAAGSSLRQSGTTNISPRLLVEFAQKTTTAPLALPTFMTISGNVTLNPQVPRYSGGPPDLGYYYDALDYTTACLVNQGSITVEPGTAIGLREDMYWLSFWGFNLWENSTFVSHGLPTRPIIFADVQWVQEQPVYPCAAGFVPDFEADPSQNGPVLDFRFCQFYPALGFYEVCAGFNATGNALASPDSVVNWTMRDCALHGGYISLGLPDSGGWEGTYGQYGIPYTTFYGYGAVDWENNLFDRVWINLQPSWNWYDGTTNVNLTFTARNNLFQHCQRLRVWPGLATTGDWTFTDNLFDAVEFSQDPAAPLATDHNGYRPLNNYGFRNGSLNNIATTNRLTDTSGTGGQHELTLDYPLPYVSGAFGNYYLSTVTPLWQAGSRTATAAGLAQYTTFENQLKDASNQPVNIGLHYVAALNPQLSTNNSQPLDTDGDGVPDYVEVEHGTDPNSPMTDGITPDALNAAYDDVDLSGNGLVGRIKKALNLDPLCPTNPLTLKQIITGKEPDFATFEVPLNYDVVTGSGSLNVNMNGIDVSLEECNRATNGNCLLTFNVDFDPTGLHYLSAGFRLGNEPPAELHPVMTADGIIQPFISSNRVQFFEANTMFDDTSAFLDAKLFVPEADYKIELFNPDTTPPTLLTTITNSTTDGMISEEWGLTNDNGSFYTGESLEAAYTVTPANSPANTPTVQAKRILTRATNSLSEWGPNIDVAYFYTPTNSALASEYAKDGAIWNGMQSVVNVLIQEQNAYDVYKSYFNRYPPDSRGEYPGYITSRSTVVSNLLTDMANGETKNFYCYGHGGSNFMGNDAGTAFLLSSDVSQKLNNYYAPSGLIAHNPYRFVFLDGCSTISAKDWRRAFGIYPVGVTNKLIRSKVGPQAYVGWLTPHSGRFNFTDDSVDSVNVAKAGAQSLANFYSDWMRGKTLKECLDNASVPSFGKIPFPVPTTQTYVLHGPGYNYVITPTNRSLSKICISGFPGLKVNTTDTGLNLNTTYAAPKNVE